MITYVVLLLIEVQDLGTPLPAALVRAAEEVLGRQARVEVRVVDRDAPPATDGALARAQGAAAVARLTWADAQRLRGRLDVTVIVSGRSEAQGLVFEDSDPLAERGRAFGLVLAALLRPDAVAHAEPPSPRPPAGILAAPASVLSPPPVARWALDAAVEGGVAFGGDGSGAGGALGVRWLPLSRLGFRLGAQARFGAVGAAQSALMTFAACAGVVADVRPTRGIGRLGLGVRADALLLYESLSHLSSDDPAPVRQGRLIPGAALLGELRWSLSSSVALTLAAGPEVAFGTTHIFVGDAEVAALPPLRAVFQGGLIAAF